MTNTTTTIDSQEIRTLTLNTVNQIMEYIDDMRTTIEDIRRTFGDIDATEVDRAINIIFRSELTNWKFDITYGKTINNPKKGVKIALLPNESARLNGFITEITPK